MNWVPAFAERVLAVEPAALTFGIRTYHQEDDSPVTPDDVDALAARAFLRAVTTISDDHQPFGPEQFARLMRSPHLVNLRTIEVFDDRIGLEGVRAIAEAPAPFALERLDLNSALQFDDVIGESDETLAAVELIASAPRFAALKHLGLTFNELGDRSIQALIASKTLPRTMRLDLTDNDYDEERFADQLAKRFDFGFDGEED